MNLINNTIWLYLLLILVQMPQKAQEWAEPYLELYVHTCLPFMVTVYHLNCLRNYLCLLRWLNETNAGKSDLFQLSIFTAFLESELEKFTDMINGFFCVFCNSFRR